MKMKRKTDQVCISTWHFNYLHLTHSLEFRGEKVKSVIDGSSIRYFSTKKRGQYLRESFLTIAIMILLVAGVTGAIYVARFVLRNYIGEGNAQLAASIMNALQIQLFNFVYNRLASALNDRENHR